MVRNLFLFTASFGLRFCKGLAAVRTGFPKVHKLQPVLKVQGQNVLFNEQLASEILPKLEFVYVLCTRTVWYGAWAMIETERQYKEHIAQGHKLRPIRFVEIEGANHFVSGFHVRFTQRLILLHRLIGMIQRDSGLLLSMPLTIKH